VRALGVDPVDDTRAVFRALCTATSRPATVREVPVAPADHGVVATLVDHEVSVHTPDDRLREALSARGRYVPAAPTEADVLHAVGVPEWDVREAPRGSLREPSEGATVLYRVGSLSEATAGDAAATTVDVSGPGVEGSRRLSLELPAGELEALADAQSTYPRGVDAVFATEGAVAAVPRSASLEVV
jgi:alpha-D-ribose 1-methylphosphonate 5-triphosphate synthase subunit PhnH